MVFLGVALQDRASESCDGTRDNRYRALLYVANLVLEAQIVCYHRLEEMHR
jgi:hypothetical protein